MRTTRAAVGAAVVGLTVSLLPATGASGSSAPVHGAIAADPPGPVTYGWRNLAWTVDTIVVRNGAERADNAPGALGLIMGKRSSAKFALDLPAACEKLRVRVKAAGITLDGGARTRTRLVRTGNRPKRYDAQTTSLDDVAWRLPDSIGRPAPGSRRFVFRVKDVTPKQGEADYTLSLTFGGYCPKR